LSLPFSPSVELQPVLLEKFFELALVLARFAPWFRLLEKPIRVGQGVQKNSTVVQECAVIVRRLTGIFEGLGQN